MAAITVMDGPLYQWDTGRRVRVIPDLGENIELVHYSNGNVVETQLDGDNVIAPIPNILLQTPKPITVYAVMTSADGIRTVTDRKIPVNAKPKPDDYVYTETEVMSWQALDASMREFMSSVQTAYDIAVKHGYEGTEEEWIAELQGNAAESTRLASEAQAKAEEAQRKAEQAQTGAEQSATNAANSATAAKASEQNASVAATNAGNSEQNAVAAKNSATEAARQAELSRQGAAQSETNAAASADEAKKAAESAGGIKTVNGVAPDENGNVQVETSAQADWNAPEGAPGHVLNRTHWVEQGEELVLDTTVTLRNKAGNIEVPFELEAGKAYSVHWDNTEYYCTASTKTADGYTSVALNIAGVAEVIALSPELAELLPGSAGVVNSDYGYDADDPYKEITYDLAIYLILDEVHKLPGKYLPDGVPYSEGGGKTEILPETKLTAPYPEEEPGIFTITTPISLTIGEQYTVNLDGTEYQSTAIDGGVLNSDFAGLPVLMNDGVDMSTGEGIVFLLLVVPPEAFEETGYYAMLQVVSGATELTISIYQGSETIHKLENKFLDLDWLPTKGMEAVIVAETTVTDSSAVENGCRLEDFGFDIGSVSVGQHLIVHFDGKPYEVVVKESNGFVYIGNFTVIPDFSGGEPDTGEPFCVVSTLNVLVWQADSGDTHTIAIYGEGYNKMPEEYLPVGVLRLLGTSLKPGSYATISPSNFTLQEDGTYKSINAPGIAPDGTVEARVIPTADSRAVANAANLRVLYWSDSWTYLVCDRLPTADVTYQVYYYGLT